MTVAARIAQLHLLYLCTLPAVGTLLLYLVFRIQINPFLFLLLGTAGVGIYVAFTASYTIASKNALVNLARLLDGPLWIAAASFFGGSAATFLVEDVLVETIGILLGIFLLSGVSSLPTRDQRIGSLVATGLPLLGALVILVWYGRETLSEAPLRLPFIAGAIVQGAFVQFRTAARDIVERPAEGYILYGIILWIASLIAGAAIADSWRT